MPQTCVLCRCLFCLQVVTVELNSNQDPRLTDIAEVEAKFKRFHQLAEAKGELAEAARRRCT